MNLPDLAADAPCEPPGDVAVLITGLVTTAQFPSLPAHLQAIVSQVVSPFSADVHAAYEATGCLLGHSEAVCAADLQRNERVVDATLAQVLGARLRAIATCRGAAASRFAFAAPRSLPSEGGVLHTYAIEPKRAMSLRMPKMKSTLLQWYKLSQAWTLMEASEMSQGSLYTTVIKLRFDIVPLGKPAWRLCASRDFLRKKDPPAIHAMSDLVFWGRRDAMAVVASTWEHIDYFEKPLGGAGRPLLATRPTAVTPTLRSVLSLPPFEDWTLYLKIGHINVPDMGSKRKVMYKAYHTPKGLPLAHSGMVENLRAARAAGWEWIDPLASRPGAPNVTAMVRCAGVGHRKPCGGAVDGQFITERDFVWWALLNNVSVCDLGAETAAVLHKGRLVARRAYNGCARSLPGA
ncbi:hypothetical protein T492DRAFT_1079012 [Pavlovales sp. CCMP2436]|nr:hypothetical protein T492DRAFT_1079012 [Pavlovales sp. CCMP2436]